MGVWVAEGGAAVRAGELACAREVMALAMGVLGLCCGASWRDGVGVVDAVWVWCVMAVRWELSAKQSRRTRVSIDAR